MLDEWNSTTLVRTEVSPLRSCWSHVILAFLLYSKYRKNTMSLFLMVSTLDVEELQIHLKSLKRFTSGSIAILKGK